METEQWLCQQLVAQKNRLTAHSLAHAVAALAASPATCSRSRRALSSSSSAAVLTCLLSHVQRIAATGASLAHAFDARGSVTIGEVIAKLHRSSGLVQCLVTLMVRFQEVER